MFQKRGEKLFFDNMSFKIMLMFKKNNNNMKSKAVK
jgi:hypothetical protein